MALFRKGFVTLALLAGSLLVIYAAVRTPANATHTGSFIRNTSSGFVVDVVGALQNNGQPVILFLQHGGENQLYDVQFVGGNRFMFVARHSGKCLDVTGFSTQDGAPIIQWDCHGGPNQVWELGIMANPGPCPPFGCATIGTTIRAVHSGKCLDAANPNFPTPPPQGAPLQQWSCARNTDDSWWRNQTWAVDPLHPPAGPH
jgi:Ricin-type beta-trefoil lectin domain-like